MRTRFYKTYALIDLIGITEQLRQGLGDERVKAFWNSANTWATHVSSDIRARLRDRNVEEGARVRVAAFSDSLLVSTDTEYETEDFFTILRSLRERVTRAAGEHYCIVGGGWSINPGNARIINISASGSVTRSPSRLRCRFDRAPKTSSPVLKST